MIFSYGSPRFMDLGHMKCPFPQVLTSGVGAQDASVTADDVHPDHSRGCLSLYYTVNLLFFPFFNCIFLIQFIISFQVSQFY